MAGTRAIKNRIKSTKNIQQITKAMQAVSAVKMRKSEQAALSGRPYAYAALSILRNVEKSLKEDARSVSPYLDNREIKRTLLVSITSDKGLAGAFNTNVIRKSLLLIKNSTVPVDVIAVGKKGRDFLNRRGASVVKDFTGFGDVASIEKTHEVSKLVSKLYLDKTYDQVLIVYTNFVSALKQEVIVRTLLPFSEESLIGMVHNIIPQTGKFSNMKRFTDSVNEIDFKFEPSAKNVLSSLLSQLLQIQVYHSILEANASEHSSRMVAMKNASQNAKEMIGALTITYNKVRQANITKELIEITSGREALTQ